MPCWTPARAGTSCLGDAAIIYLFLDCGLRLSELAGLRVDDVDIRDRIVYVEGKSSNRSGPRPRSVRADVKCAQALDRYLRERRRHPFAEQPQLWLGDRGRTAITVWGIEAMLERRAARVGIHVHPHMFGTHGPRSSAPTAAARVT